MWNYIPARIARQCKVSYRECSRGSTMRAWSDFLYGAGNFRLAMSGLLYKTLSADLK